MQREYFKPNFDITPNKPIFNVFLNHLIAMISKLSSLVVSLKVLSFIGITWLCTRLLISGYIESGDFTIIITTVISVLLVAREGLKISNVLGGKWIKEDLPEMIDSAVKKSFTKHLEESKANKENINKD